MDLFPADFVARMRGWLGSQSDAFFAAMAKRDVGLRLNPGRGTIEELKSRIPWATTPVPWCPEGLIVETGSVDTATDTQVGAAFSPGTHPYHVAGVYYLQDPSAMAAAVLKKPPPPPDCGCDGALGRAFAGASRLPCQPGCGEGS